MDLDKCIDNFTRLTSAPFPWCVLDVLEAGGSGHYIKEFIDHGLSYRCTDLLLVSEWTGKSRVPLIGLLKHGRLPELKVYIGEDSFAWCNMGVLINRARGGTLVL